MFIIEQAYHATSALLLFIAGVTLAHLSLGQWSFVPGIRGASGAGSFFAFGSSAIAVTQAVLKGRG